MGRSLAGRAGATLGTADRGPDAVARLHFPGLHPEAATWIVGERRVKAVGIDTASIDFGQSTFFMSHRILYAADIPGFRERRFDGEASGVGSGGRRAPDEDPRRHRRAVADRRADSARGGALGRRGALETAKKSPVSRRVLVASPCLAEALGDAWGIFPAPFGAMWDTLAALQRKWSEKHGERLTISARS
jgi:hypothetical protein